MKTFAQKKEALAKIKDKLGKSKLTVFTSFSRKGEKGLNVPAMQELKKKLRESDAQYVVEKKTILDRALKSYKHDVDVSRFGGSTGVIFGYGDEAKTAKSAYSFAKSNPALKFFGGLFNGKFIDDKEFADLAKLPNREIMQARVVGMIKYPISSLVNVLNANIRNLVGVLHQVANKK